MKAMLGIVLVVTILAKTGAYVPEYSNDSVLTYSPADPEGRVSNATIFNADAELRFQVSDSPNDGVIIMIPDSVPNSAEIVNNICGTSLGIHITNNEETFCDLTFFLLKVDSYDILYTTEVLDTDVQAQKIQLTVGFDNGVKLLLVEVPVFEIPSKHASADQEELKKWAVDNQVGIDSPFSNQTMLNDLRDKGEWKGDLKWLSDLISYGIVKSERGYKVDSETNNGAIEVLAYTARPMVLPAEVANKLIQVVYGEQE